MTNCVSLPKVLLRTIRSGIVDCDYFGSFYFASSSDIIKEYGISSDNLFFMRSLAKPLQASIIADCDIVREFDILDKELAIMTGSHAGSKKHIELLKNICKKHNIKQKEIEIVPQIPLDARYFSGIKTKLHNNCSGKHILMILMCKYLNIDSKNYTSDNHPIQKLIQKKQEELSGEKANILSYDGCSAPLWAISARGIIRAYFNLFHNEKYKKIILAPLKFPYLFGGFNRLDTEIITLGKGNLYSKVGANGFILVYNFKEDKIFLLKITQNNNPIRRLITLDALNKLGWIEFEPEKFEFNQKGYPVTKYCYEINLN